MNWLALRMLTGDTAKYLGIVFGVALGSLLIAQQLSIFVGLMRRTSSQILDVTDADVWVMDRWTQNIDEVRPMSDNRLYQVRGVEGVQWAARLLKSQVRVRLPDGNFKQCILLGLDDGSLVGSPRRVLEGSLDDLRRPDAIILDDAGYRQLFPGEPLRLGRTVEINERRGVIVGICKANAPFQAFPIVITRYSQAARYVPRERNVLSFVLARSQPGTDLAALCERITAQTGLAARTWDQFFWFNVKYFLENTGIPVNFGITVLLGFVVGSAISGQTFYLFTIENLKQFGSLKAMGVTNLRLVGMILLQAVTVGVLGLSIGLGLAAAFFVGMEASGQADLRGMYVPWQVALIASAAVGLIVLLSALISLRKVLVLEPAMVFK